MVNHERRLVKNWLKELNKELEDNKFYKESSEKKIDDLMEKITFLEDLLRGEKWN